MAVGEEAPLAVIGAGALDAETGEHKAEFTAQEQVRVAAEILPAASQVDRPADIFVVAKVTTSAGFAAWFQKNVDGGYVRWDGRLENLQPMKESEALSALERLDVYEGRLLPGEYEVYFGYLVDGGSLVYSQEPLAIRVK